MKSNDVYGINISFSANYSDEDASAKVSITDTDGLDVSSEQTGKMSAIDDVFADLFTDVSGKVLNARTAAKQCDDNKKLRADFDQLKKDHQSLKIDNNILKLRLEALQKAYDEAMNANKKAQSPAPAKEKLPTPSPYVVSNKEMENHKIHCDTTKQCRKEDPVKSAKKASTAKDCCAATAATGRGTGKSYISFSDLSDCIDSIESLYKTFFK